MTRRVLITDYAWSDLSQEQAVLEPAGVEIVVAASGSVEELRTLAVDVDAILTCFAKVDASVLNATTRCRTVARYGVGLDNIDVARATEMGMVVTNVPDYCRDEVADHTLFLLLALARRSGYGGTLAHPPVRLRGKILGLVGFGSIARAVVPRAQALGMEIVAFSRHGSGSEAPPGVSIVGFDELLDISDVVSLHLPATAQTHNLIGAKALERMKSSAFLINTARGDIVDTAALTEALAHGELAGAGLDVTAPEPLPDEHPLRSRPDVVLTPHTAFSSDGAIRELAHTAATHVLDVLDGRQLCHVVNPEVFAMAESKGREER